MLIYKIFAVLNPLGFFLICWAVTYEYVRLPRKVEESLYTPSEDAFLESALLSTILTIVFFWPMPSLF